MAIWDFRPKGDLWTGVALGAGLLAAPVVIPLAWSATRPLLKAVLKGGFMIYETGRRAFSGVAERPEERQGRAATVGKPKGPAQKKERGRETEVESIKKVEAPEEQARSGQAKPRRVTEKKPRRKAEKQK